MDEHTFPLAAKGLGLLLLGELMALAAQGLSVLENQTAVWLSGVLGAVRLVVMVLGFDRAGREHGAYQTAFYMAGVAIALSVLAGSLTDITFLMMSNLLSAGMVYFICVATVQLLKMVGRHRLARLGGYIWKIYLGSTVVRIMAGLFRWQLSILLEASSQKGVSILLATMELSGMLLFLCFLWQSMLALGSQS